MSQTIRACLSERVRPEAGRHPRTWIAVLGLAGAAAGCEPRAVHAIEPLSVRVELPAAPLELARAPGLELGCRLEFPLSFGARPEGLLARDLDGDGKPELIGLTRSPGSLQVLGGLRRDSLRTIEARVLGHGDWPVGPVWFDAEGKDPASAGLVVLAPRNPPTLLVVDAAAVWRGEQADPVRWRTPLERRARTLATADLGHDGKREVLLVTVDDDLLVFDGPESVRKLRLCDEHATCILGLPDGDGFLVGFQGSRRLVRYGPTASNSFGFEPAETLELPGLPRALLASDLDGDGDPELALALGDHALWVFGLGRPGGVRAALASRPIELAVGAVPLALAAAQLEGRPGQELVCVALAGQEFHAFAWEKDHMQLLAHGYAGQSPQGVACADFDGDGKIDLATANSGAERWSVCFGAAGGGFVLAQQTHCGRSPHSLACADLDGDGLRDVVVLNALEGTLSVLRGTRTGLADAQTLIRAPSANSLALADVDGDGHPDALWLAKQDKQVLLVTAFGDGRGGLWERASVPPLPVAASAGDLLALDLGGDDAPELVLTDPDHDALLLFARRNAPGSGALFERVASLALPHAPSGIASVDRDASGTRLCVALGGDAAGGGRMGAVLVRASRSAAGDWSLAEERFLPTRSPARWPASADLDGDGRADLALLIAAPGSDGPGIVVPVLQTPEGGWSAIEGFLTGARPYRIAAGDLDGDGRAEILVSAQNSHNVNLWSAPGKELPVFARGPDLGVGTGPLDLALDDLDGDGIPEILCTNAFSDEVSLIRVR